MSGFVSYGLLLLVMLLAHRLMILVWWKPREIQKRFLSQGIRGPPLKPFIGSLADLARIYSSRKGSPPPSEANPRHAVLQLVFPHLHIWREKYGRVFLYWYGRFPRLTITDPKLIKEVANHPRKYDQSIQHPAVYKLLGGSILEKGGEAWATKRRLLNPLFLVERLKGLSGLVHQAIDNKVEAWNKLMESSDKVEIDVHKEFESLSQYIIARVIFGDDLEDGLHIVRLQSEQANLTSQSVKTFYIPGWRFLPTRFNRRTKWVRQEAEKTFKEIIKRRDHSERTKQDDDWLSLMLSLNNMSQQHIIDDCCAMVIAGSETTNLVLDWACMLLSIHTEWQDKAREEIHQALESRHSQPTLEIVSRLKILTMIINETLRLYPSFPFIMKKAIEDTTVDGLTIPAGTYVEVPIIAVHHDPQQWGDNVDQFDPGRFAGGIAKASKDPMAFLPFMQGPRICLGMNFAMMEARITLATVLNNFTFRLSPNYKHELEFGITLKPAKGVPVIFSKI